jgi:putative transposase
MTSKAILTWQQDRNGFVDSLNGRLRDECLNEHLFSSLRHARHLIAAWRDDYTNIPPRTRGSSASPSGSSSTGQQATKP